MFNIGLPEFMMLAIIAIIFVGPERLPVVARWLGKQAARVRRAWRDLQSEMSSDEDFRAIKQAGNDLRNELKSVKKEFTKAQTTVQDAAQDSSTSFMGADHDGSNTGTADPFDDELEILRQSGLADDAKQSDGSKEPEEEGGDAKSKTGVDG